MRKTDALYVEYYDTKTNRRLKPVSKDTIFDYHVLEQGIQQFLSEDTIEKPYQDDLNNYDDFTVRYSECDSAREQLQPNDRGETYTQRLFAAIKYNRDQSRKNHL
jgi:hypothetical protein